MREIKFRAWDKKLKKMFFNVKNFDENTFSCNEGKEEKDYIWKIMQFTGLKDKNGTDIYEGDIVENQINMEHLIFFECGSFFMRAGTTKFPICTNYYPLKVIGNIHENPELLGEKE